MVSEYKRGRYRPASTVVRLQESLMRQPDWISVRHLVPRIWCNSTCYAMGLESLGRVHVYASSSASSPTPNFATTTPLTSVPIPRNHTIAHPPSKPSFVYSTDLTRFSRWHDKPRPSSLHQASAYAGPASPDRHSHVGMVELPTGIERPWPCRSVATLRYIPVPTRKSDRVLTKVL
ncbi:hypothetical protein P171DRAFT_149095 [Karstenula rhodostoma CBS 690.94]|uniref:Uncharacterized protein n=1 Tax=Karstenula rhodostoma CBS 690.94 TaxID=1392251 RepID=A0A9P4UJ34_9PLEO|nr:hypothetical protein P171DRAFT_149095 [Karstenula rhodostoma CBS 690.94]